MDATDAYNANIEAIAAYLQSGESSNCELLGMEIEHFVLDSDDNAVFYEGQNGKPGVRDILEALVDSFGTPMMLADSDGVEHIVGINHPGCPITLEPGAQLEVSIGAFASIAEIDAAYAQFREAIDPILDSYGYKLATFGYNPSICACRIPLIPKPRYAMMDLYFHATGRHGVCMMRGSASTQVSIDYSDEADCIRKMRIASILSPLLYMATDNSPIFDREYVGICGGTESETPTKLDVPRRMARSAIWDDVDADRSMVASFLFEDPSYAGYARMLLSRPPILTMDEAEDGRAALATYHDDEATRDIYDGRLMGAADIEHILSMFFFDVRLKKYIEIRMADSMPIDFALSYVALIKGVFYNEDALSWLDGELSGIGLDDIAIAKAELSENGYDAVVYGKPASEWLDELAGFAAQGLEDAQRTYLEPMASLIASRRVLAEKHRKAE